MISKQQSCCDCDAWGAVRGRSGFEAPAQGRGCPNAQYNLQCTRGDNSQAGMNECGAGMNECGAASSCCCAEQGGYSLSQSSE